MLHPYMVFTRRGGCQLWGRVKHLEDVRGFDMPGVNQMLHPYICFGRWVVFLSMVWFAVK